MTNPGHDYSNVTVSITGAGHGASAVAVVVKKGAVTGIAVTDPGSGYTAPTVSIPGGKTPAAATAYGRVDAVLLASPGGGYTFPTVNFDLPDDPNGVQASGHVTCVEVACQPDPGGRDDHRRRRRQPGLRVRHRSRRGDPRRDPVRPGRPRPSTNPLTPATATTTLAIDSIVVDAPGAGFSKPPAVAIVDPSGSGATAVASIDNGIISSIKVKKPGTGYVTPGGIKKFQDGAPGPRPDRQRTTLASTSRSASPDTTTFPDADYYVIALVQHREQMSSCLPAKGTLLREYVQLDPGEHAGEARPPADRPGTAPRRRP